AARYVVCAHRGQVAPDQPRARVGNPFADQWPLSVSVRSRATRLEIQGDAASLCKAHGQRPRPSGADHQHRAFPPGRTWDVKRPGDLPPRLSLDRNALGNDQLIGAHAAGLHCGRFALIRGHQFADFGNQFLRRSLTFFVSVVFKNALIEIATLRFVGDLTAASYLKLVFGIKLHWLLAPIAFAFIQPSDHPFVDGLADFARRAVRAGANDPADLLFGAVDPVPTPRLFINQPRALRREEIFERRSDQPRLRRE